MKSIFIGIFVIFLIGSALAQVNIGEGNGQTIQGVSILSPKESGGVTNTTHINSSQFAEIWLANGCVNGECDDVGDIIESVNWSNHTDIVLNQNGNFTRQVGFEDLVTIVSSGTTAWKYLFTSGGAEISGCRVFGLFNGFCASPGEAFFFGIDNLMADNYILVHDFGYNFYEADTNHQFQVNAFAKMNITSAGVELFNGNLDLNDNDIVDVGATNGTTLQIDENALITNTETNSINITGEFHSGRTHTASYGGRISAPGQYLSWNALTSTQQGQGFVMTNWGSLIGLGVSGDINSFSAGSNANITIAVEYSYANGTNQKYQGANISLRDFSATATVNQDSTRFARDVWDLPKGATVNCYVLLLQGTVNADASCNMEVIYDA